MNSEAPYIAVIGEGVDVRIWVEDEDDENIVKMAVAMAIKRAHESKIVDTNEQAQDEG